MFADVPSLAGRTVVSAMFADVPSLAGRTELFLLCLQMYPLWLVELSCFCYVFRCTLSGW